MIPRAFRTDYDETLDPGTNTPTPSDLAHEPPTGPCDPNVCATLAQLQDQIRDSRNQDNTNRLRKLLGGAA